MRGERLTSKGFRIKDFGSGVFKIRNADYFTQKISRDSPPFLLGWRHSLCCGFELMVHDLAYLLTIVLRMMSHLLTCNGHRYEWISSLC